MREDGCRVFGLFKARKKERSGGELGPGNSIITALLLDGDSYPVDAFLEQLAAAGVSGRAVSDMQRNEKTAFSFSVGDESFALTHISRPAPHLDGPIATTWMWPPRSSLEEVKHHRSHLLIGMLGGTSDPVRRRLLLTAVTSLAAQQPGVVAVYWPEAALVIFPTLFAELTRSHPSPEAPPLYLWIDVRVFRNEDGTMGLFTVGLPALGHQEIEIPRVDMEPGDLREWLLSIMYYLIENGPVLKEGHTISMSAQHMFRIRHRKSKFGHPGKVISLEP